MLKAEECGIPGSKEARTEFDLLLQRTNVPGQRQAQKVGNDIDSP